MSKNNILMSEENRKYVNAFVKVAKMLEPSIEFDDVIIQKHSDENSTNIDIAVSGVSRLGNLIQVTKELSKEGNGLEIVIRYIDPIVMRTIRERRIWYFSFNWKGLMACE